MEEEYPQPDWGKLIGIIIGLILGLIICACLGSCKSKAKVESSVSIKADSVFHKVSVKTDSTALFSKWLRNYIDTSVTWEFTETSFYDTDKADSNGVSPISKKVVKASITKNGKSERSNSIKSEAAKTTENTTISDSVGKATDSIKKATYVPPKQNIQKKSSKKKYLIVGVIIGVLVTLYIKYQKKIVTFVKRLTKRIA